MVPCHSCHIYGIWTGKSKNVWRMLKSHQLGVGDASHKWEALFIGKADSHCVMLYCETLLQVLRSCFLRISVSTAIIYAIIYAKQD